MARLISGPPLSATPEDDRRWREQRAKGVNPMWSVEEMELVDRAERAARFGRDNAERHISYELTVQRQFQRSPEAIRRVEFMNQLAEVARVEPLPPEPEPTPSPGYRELDLDATKEIGTPKVVAREIEL